jgi:adenosylmethionine-8-amino-7-oxononanoate aminotransferase
MSAVLARVPGAQALKLVRAQGTHLFTEDGREVIDAISGAMVVNLGYANEEIISAMTQQAREIAYVHNARFTVDATEELAARLSGLLGGAYAVYFCGSGSETIEAAIRINHAYHASRGTPLRRQILASRKSYHGSSLGALALSGLERIRKNYEPILERRVHVRECFCTACPFGAAYPGCDLLCAREIAEHLEIQADEIGAVFLESMSANALGAFLPPPEYLRSVRARTAELGQLLILDEIATSIGRTGKNFAFEHSGDLRPDLICLSKGLGVGYVNIGAVLVHERVVEVLRSGQVSLLGHTYNASPVACAVGLTALRILEEERLVERNQALGRRLLQGLHEIAQRSPFVREARGKGLLAALEICNGERPFPQQAGISQQVSAALLRRGVLVLPGSGALDGGAGDHFTLAPQFVSSPEEIDTILDRITDFFASFEREVTIPHV